MVSTGNLTTALSFGCKRSACHAKSATFKIDCYLLFTSIKRSALLASL
ncbi:hypothetical protein PPAR_a2675 [Pseudoalteromonas paragorgicola KMM 3548]|nr:hypothetical protein [Pseudoalteromonas distincta KMM 3548]